MLRGVGAVRELVLVRADGLGLPPRFDVLDTKCDPTSISL